MCGLCEQRAMSREPRIFEGRDFIFAGEYPLSSCLPFQNLLQDH